MLLHHIYKLIQPLIFKIDPESLHGMVNQFLKIYSFLNTGSSGKENRLRQNFFGKEFKNPVGMAAGYDKEGDLIRGIASLGFGFLECGTFTLNRQAGNPRPRIFRIPEKRAIVNRMGFNNPGIEAGLKNIVKLIRAPLSTAISIGKSKETSPEDAAKDYHKIIELINACPLVDNFSYIALNISSPNTPGLRVLQSKEYLFDLIKGCRDLSRLPIVVKVAPDFSNLKEFSEVVNTVVSAGASGLIVTNTTTDPNFFQSIPEYIREKGGGISGAPLKERSLVYLKEAYSITGQSVPLISSGGLMGPADPWERLLWGASLVQIYTGLIYYGPAIAFDSIAYMKEQMEKLGIVTIGEVTKNREYIRKIWKEQL